MTADLSVERGVACIHDAPMSAPYCGPCRYDVQLLVWSDQAGRSFRLLPGMVIVWTDGERVIRDGDPEFDQFRVPPPNAGSRRAEVLSARSPEGGTGNDG